MLTRRTLIALSAALLAVGCGGAETKQDPNALSVAATAVPHAEILEFVKPENRKVLAYVRAYDRHADHPLTPSERRELDARMAAHLEHFGWA